MSVALASTKHKEYNKRVTGSDSLVALQFVQNKSNGVESLAHIRAITKGVITTFAMLALAEITKHYSADDGRMYRAAHENLLNLTTYRASAIRGIGLGSKRNYVTYTDAVHRHFRAVSTTEEEYHKLLETYNNALQEEINVIQEGVFEDFKMYKMKYISDKSTEQLTPFEQGLLWLTTPNMALVQMLLFLEHPEKYTNNEVLLLLKESEHAEWRGAQVDFSKEVDIAIGYYLYAKEYDKVRKLSTYTIINK